MVEFQFDFENSYFRSKDTDFEINKQFENSQFFGFSRQNKFRASFASHAAFRNHSDFQN